MRQNGTKKCHHFFTFLLAIKLTPWTGDRLGPNRRKRVAAPTAAAEAEEPYNMSRQSELNASIDKKLAFMLGNNIRDHNLNLKLHQTVYKQAPPKISRHAWLL